MLAQRIAKSYKKYTGVTKVTGGQLNLLEDGSYAIEASYSVTDCDVPRKRATKKLFNFKFDQSRDISTGSVNCQCTNFGVQTDHLAEAISKDERYKAYLVYGPGTEVNAEKNQVLEIWEDADHKSESLIKSIDISELKEHGKIVLNDPFFVFKWDSCTKHDKLLYTCLTKPKKYHRLFQDIPDGSDKKNVEDADQEFNKKDDWGETLDGIDHTMLGVLSISDNFSINVIDLKDYSLANSQWLKDGKILSIAYQENPRHGFVYCNNRPSIIVCHDSITGNLLSKFESKGTSFSHLRVNHAADKFLVAENNTFGPHFQPSKLKLYDENLNLISELTKDPLFLQCIPEQCFSEDDTSILFGFSKDLKTQVTLLYLHNLHQVHIPTPTPTVSAITFKYDLMLICGSGINQPPCLYLHHINSKKCVYVVKPENLEFIRYEVIQDIPTNDKSAQLSAIMATSTSQPPNEDTITVFVVHGGPCCSYGDVYYENFAFLNKIGINVIFVNYRGSTDLDETHLRKLSGNAGVMDVEDCAEVIRYFIRRKLVSPNKLALFGGSHGGFLLAHLCTLDEFKFTSAIMINPVLDMVSSYFTADIPDWIMEVILGKNYDPKWLPQLQEVTTMFNRSPLYNASKSRVPTLMLLGSKDKRVKMYQGLRWIEYLQRQGVETCCKVYPDTHQLLNHIPHFFVSATKWLVDHAGGESSIHC